MCAPVYFVRHGESEWNVQRLTQGQTSHPRLTPLGRSQAAVAADALADLLGATSIRLISSDLTRAVETAQIIGDTLGVEVELDRRLREQHLGSLEGRPYEESWAEAERHDWSDPEAPVAGGESVAAVRRRLAALLAELDLDLDPGRPSVLVSHGDAIRAALAHLAGESVTDATWVEVPNGSVARWDGRVSWLDPVRHPGDGRHHG